MHSTEPQNQHQHDSTKACRPQGGRASPLGLSCSVTSDSRYSPDPKKQRLARMSNGVQGDARLINQSLSDRPESHYVALITGTYAQDGAWSPKHITKLIKNIRDWLARRNVPYLGVWCAETTKRGRPHYHIAIWLPQGTKLPKPDQSGWWIHGMTRIERVRCQQATAAYLAKYMSKGTSESPLPKGMRMFGSGGLSGEWLLAKRWQRLPLWLRKKTTPADSCIRLKGVGYVSRASGEQFESDWQVIGFYGGRVHLQKKSQAVPQLIN